MTIAQKEQTPVPIWLAIVRLLRWDKPAGRLILMIPALWAVFLAAKGSPPIPLVGAIVFGTLATSAAGCVVNDLWDRNIDSQVARTRNRPLAERSLSVKVGFGVAIVALICAWAIASYLNPLSFWLSVAAVPVIVLYPAAKRVFPVPQLVMAVAWGFAVLISWSSVTASLDKAMWMLWGATVLWALGFDTIYAMSDREDDRKLGVNSSALFFGNYAPIAVAICFALTVLLMGWLGVTMQLNVAFWLTLGLAALGWTWQYLRLNSPSMLSSAYGEMFRQNVWIGFILLAGMIAGVL
ncbi:4-hydroxybenzoate solanesyltransferase [Synechocystis sp. PCC 7509]|uniref:4-hydroxybenzoate solanesyltransferase n=1 Tax=Synechocystis sp. PCC 7509 TaxID=927677 RepID=UPI0002ABD00A|nr:4-hydroxybenzoate solanesyltransferase [Synechocystis sp. PCC 7509]